MTIGPGDLPEVRGQLRFQVALAPLTWFRVGGPAAVVFNPKDAQDLAAFRRQTSGLPSFPIGVGSNLLVRDAGIDAVVCRFGGELSRVEVDGGTILAGSGALDQKVAQVAQAAGLSGLEFMIGIPGTIGGAVRMNAGAFGGETADRFLWAEAVDQAGELHRLGPDDLAFSYRHSVLPADWIVVRAAFGSVPGDAEVIRARMEDIRREREAAQPLRVATGGSTFKNPPGKKAWQLIDAAGCRGLRHGAAMVSDKHCNFLINTGGASAAELEALGEMVRQAVRRQSGVELDWEIVRIGEPGAVRAVA